MKSLGYVGEEIGEILELILELTTTQQIPNVRSALMAFAADQKKIKQERIKIMSNFTMLIGPSGSGKSSYAQKLCSKTNNTVVLSSDAIRKELFGNENDQSDNQKVFLTMTGRAINYLNSGTNVIWDATSMTRKHRMGILQQIPKNTAKHAIVISSTVKEIIERDSKRERTVGEDVIMKQLMSFQTPWFTEGFDDIAIVGSSGYTKDELIKMMKECLHENPNHRDGPVWNHCIAMRKGFIHDTVSDEKHVYAANDWVMVQTCMYHDCGKPLTKTYDKNGSAHYYGHAGMGAYMYTTTLMYSGTLTPSSDAQQLQIAVIIGEHMNMHQKDFDVDKLETRIGKELTDLCRQLRYYDRTYA